MKQSKTNRIAQSVSRKLDRLASNSDFLPMLHETHRRRRGRITCEEWQEWIQRSKRHRSNDPRYESRFRRAAEVTVDRVFNLLDPVEPLLQAVAPPAYGFMNAMEIAERGCNSRTAMLMALELFVRGGLECKRVTFTDLVDTLAAAFSPHYLKCSSSITSLREMTAQSIRSCRRDLLLRGVLADRIWDAIINWKENPLFRLRIANLGGDTVITPELQSGSRVFTEFQKLITSDSIFDTWSLRKFGLKLVDGNQKGLSKRHRPLLTRRLRQDICGESPYNVVQVSDTAKSLLRIQERVTLHFDVDAFIEDYVAAEQVAKDVEQELRESYGVRADLSTLPRPTRKRGKRKKWVAGPRIWPARAEEIFYRSVAVVLLGPRRYPTEALTPLKRDEVREKYSRHLTGFKRWVGLATKRDGDEWERIRCEAQELRQRLPQTPEELYYCAREARPWRVEVGERINEYDAAKLHLAIFAYVREQVRFRTGKLLPIRTRFGYILSRRFHPEHLWPTHVTSRRSWIPSDDEFTDSEGEPSMSEERAESLRTRWFKWRAAAEGSVYDLVGCDISSSQMQVLATLLGDEQLEEVTMLRERSFKESMADLALGCDPPVLEGVEDHRYAGRNDRQLQNLVKELLMRVGYGSSPTQVAREQRRQPLEYGPGWREGGAEEFVGRFEATYPRVGRFLQACKRIAEVAMIRDPCSGVVFRDPVDHREVRWNPIKSKRIHIDFSDKKAYLRVPVGAPNRHGQYPVDDRALGRLVMPCLVHMLDAFYSGLVMSELRKRGCRAFVGIHDCWLVPAPELPRLREAMTAAAATWYTGLNCVYEDLYGYLEREAEYADLIKSAWSTWKQRRGAGYVPKFKAKDTEARRGSTVPRLDAAIAEY